MRDPNCLDALGSQVCTLRVLKCYNVVAWNDSKFQRKLPQKSLELLVGSQQKNTNIDTLKRRCHLRYIELENVGLVGNSVRAVEFEERVQLSQQIIFVSSKLRLFHQLLLFERGDQTVRVLLVIRAVQLIATQNLCTLL